MKIAVFGAYGFLGHNLVTALGAMGDHHIIAVSRSSRPPFWTSDSNSSSRITAVSGDVRDYDFVRNILQRVDAAYYLVHFMGHPGGDMYEQEAAAAENFGRAARAAALGNLIYMGGLGSRESGLSEHLLSRHRSGELLRQTAPRVIEFQASMIIGRGSVSFDIIDRLVTKLPVVLLPRATRTLTQPIALRQVLEYLITAVDLPPTEHAVFEIGGPEVLSYQALYRKYRQFSGRRQIVLEAPFVSLKLEAHCLNLFIPQVHARIGTEIMTSLTTEMVVRDNRAASVFPGVKPISLLQAFAAATQKS